MKDGSFLKPARNQRAPKAPPPKRLDTHQQSMLKILSPMDVEIRESIEYREVRTDPRGGTESDSRDVQHALRTEIPTACSSERW